VSGITLSRLDREPSSRIRAPSRLPLVHLATLPTPVEPLRALGRVIGHPGIFVKRDDLSSPTYGGNKVRKLELLLADALEWKADTVLTVGALGSNHVLATAVHAAAVGLRVRAVLFPRPVTPGVLETTLATIDQGATVRMLPATVLVPFALLAERAAAARAGERVAAVPGGGSSALGSVGYVLAALELRRQVDAGLLPEPDHLYVALGSCGTAAGLLAGLRLAGLRTRLTAVRVVPRIVANATQTVRLANAALGLLARCGWDHGAVPLRLCDLRVVHDFMGKGYGHPTEAGAEAVRLLLQHEGIGAELTYTGKTLAALFADARTGVLPAGETALYWHTYNASDMGALLRGPVDAARLPGSLRGAFG
jgi:D-cysteine desulfhydrase